jgi:hypothetical protein
MNTLNPCKFCGALIPKPANMDWWKYHRLGLCPGEWTLDARGKKVLIRSACQVEYQKLLGREKGKEAKGKGTGARGEVNKSQAEQRAYNEPNNVDLRQARLNLDIDRKRFEVAFSQPILPRWLMSSTGASVPTNVVTE